MAFPQTANPTESAIAASTTHDVLMPPTVNAGDGLIALIVTDDDNETINTPADWTLKGTGAQAGGQSVTMKVFAIVAAGTEGGTTVNFSTGTSEPMAAHVYRVTDWAGTIDDIVCSTAVDVNSGTSFDPPSFDSGFGAGDHLWIAAIGYNEDDAPTSYSTDYTGGTHHASGATLGDVSVASCRKEVSAGTENPGAITIGGTGSAGWAFTIAVKTSGGGGGAAAGNVAMHGNFAFSRGGTGTAAGVFVT